MSEGSSEGSIEGIDEGTSEGTIEGTSGLADGGVCEEVMIESGSHSTLLFTVPKRFHKRANKRNLLRRRVKEAYRLNKSILEGLSLHIALVYSTKEALDYAHISKSVVRILHQIREEANR